MFSLNSYFVSFVQTQSIFYFYNSNELESNSINFFLLKRLFQIVKKISGRTSQWKLTTLHTTPLESLYAPMEE